MFGRTWINAQSELTSIPAGKGTSGRSKPGSGIMSGAPGSAGSAPGDRTINGGTLESIVALESDPPTATMMATAAPSSDGKHKQTSEPPPTVKFRAFNLRHRSETVSEMPTSKKQIDSKMNVSTKIHSSCTYTLQTKGLEFDTRVKSGRM